MACNLRRRFSEWSGVDLSCCFPGFPWSLENHEPLIDASGFQYFALGTINLDQSGPFSRTGSDS